MNITDIRILTKQRIDELKQQIKANWGQSDLLLTQNSPSESEIYRRLVEQDKAELYKLTEALNHLL